ncbi:unnamed protein product [Malus baccata var. baccata]
MSSPSDRRFDLNLVEEAATPSLDNIWRPSFVSPTGPLTVGDFVMKNDMTAAVVARNLHTPKDNKLISKRSDELAIKDSMALSVQAVPRNEASNDQPLMPPPSRVLSSTEAPNDPPPVHSLSGALPTAETSPKQPL